MELSRISHHPKIQGYSFTLTILRFIILKIGGNVDIAIGQCKLPKLVPQTKYEFTDIIHELL